MKTITSFRKMLVVLPGAVLCYLLQACVMENLTILGVTGSVIWAFLAVVVVYCGKKGAFCAAAITGMLTEAMLASVKGLYVICIPVLTVAWAQVFADMTDRQRERRAVMGRGKRQDDLPAPLRIVLCAACMTASMNVIFLAYVYLSGVSLTFGHIVRALLNVVYTVGLAALLMTPVRAALGMYRRPETRFKGGEML